VESDAWYDATPEDGFCWPGNFDGGTTGIGVACTADGDCTSPFGLGFCTRLTDPGPSFCSVSCNVRLAGEALCGAAGPGGIVAGVCYSGMCFDACDRPGSRLGRNGCTSAGMACLSVSDFAGDVTGATGGTLPAGFCFPPCTDNAWCAAVWGGGTCNTSTGVCG
jgi:hypothetical protein